MTSQANLQSCQLVLDGNFNPYLVSPEWLKAENVWTSDSVRLALGAIKDGVQFQDETTQWSVSSNHLKISSLDGNCGDMASRVLEQLPHTPIRSVRADFIFHNEPGDSSSLVFDALASGPIKELQPDLLTAGAIIHRQGMRIEVRLVNGKEGVTASVQFFRQAPNVASAITAAQAFEVDKEESSKIINSILG